MNSSFLLLVKAESHKLRRRWMFWILLGLAIGITQIPYWAAYAAGDPDLRLRLPESVSSGLAFGHGLTVILIIIWTASALGSEYGWGTFRTVLVRGTGRWQFLAAQFSLMSATVLVWLVAIAVGVAISSVVGALLSAEGFGIAGSFPDVGEVLGRSLYAVLPYIALTMFFVVLTSSAGVATAITLGYMFIVEGVIVPVLAEFVKGFDVVADFILGTAVRAWMASGGTEGGGFFGRGPDDLVGPVQAFLVILVYIAALSAATVYLFNRKDIGGPRGP